MSSGEDVRVRLLARNEAALLIGLIRRCYGEGYIHQSFYDGSQVQERLASGRLHSIGAFAESGQLVGHMGISLRPYGGAGFGVDTGLMLANVPADVEFQQIVAHLDISLADPGAPVAVELVRAQGPCGSSCFG